MMQNKTIFCCPNCKAVLITKELLLSCLECEFKASSVEGIPLLVKNQDALKKTISEAQQSIKSSWYEDSQGAQLQGPYRHHLEKRRRYCENVIAAYTSKYKNPLVGLDLGCGDGTNIKWLAKHFSALYASDYNLLRLMRASRIQGAKRIYMADVTDYPVIDNAFDVIFFNHVLEHIPDDELALAETYRIIKPGGLLILGVPNEGVAFWQLAYKLQPRSLKATDHVHFYTADSLVEKCKRTGWKVLDIHHIGFGVPHWTLDSMLRGYELLDDLFELIGQRFIPSQATSLYLLLSK